MKCKQHKYKKIKLGKDKSYLVYACQLPGCNHYIRPELLPGKLATCFRCSSTFIVTPDMVRVGREMLKLHCKDCTKTKEKKRNAPENILENLLANLGIGKEN